MIGQAGCANTGGQRFCLVRWAGDKGAPDRRGDAEAHRSVLPAPSHRPRKMRLAVRALLACAVLGECRRGESPRSRQLCSFCTLHSATQAPGFQSWTGRPEHFLRFSPPQPRGWFSMALGSAPRLRAAAGPASALAAFGALHASLLPLLLLVQ